MQKSWKPISAGILNIVAGILLFSWGFLQLVLIPRYPGGSTDPLFFLGGIFFVVVAVLPIIGGIYAMKRIEWGWVLTCSSRPQGGGPEMGETFGLHLMLDGYGCDPAKLESEDFVLGFLDEFPENIGMTKLMSPYVSRYGGAEHDTLGLSGFVLIAESHVSIHTFPDEGCVSIDIFSCKSFDTAAAEHEIVEKFCIRRIERNILDRGVEYPKNADVAKRLVDSEREQCQIRVAGAW